MPSNLPSRVADHAITLSQVLRFATTSKHPQRRKIALAVPGLGVSSMNPMRGVGKETAVEAAPLSDFIDGPLDLLKIDIEGSETAAFEELEASGKMPLIGFMFIEYHHHLPGEDHGLFSFLSRLERCGFDYETASFMPKAAGGFQDIVIRAWRRNNSVPIGIEQKAWKTS